MNKLIYCVFLAVLAMLVVVGCDTKDDPYVDPVENPDENPSDDNDGDSMDVDTNGIWAPFDPYDTTKVHDFQPVRMLIDIVDQDSNSLIGPDGDMYKADFRISVIVNPSVEESELDWSGKTADTALMYNYLGNIIPNVDYFASYPGSITRGTWFVLGELFYLSLIDTPSENQSQRIPTGRYMYGVYLFSNLTNPDTPVQNVYVKLDWPDGERSDILHLVSTWIEGDRHGCHTDELWLNGERVSTPYFMLVK